MVMLELRCPVTGLRLRRMSFQAAESAAGSLRARVGASDPDPDEVFLRQDEALAYPVRNGVPVVLAPEALTQVVRDVDLGDRRWAEAYAEMDFYTGEAAHEPEDHLVEALRASERRSRAWPGSTLRTRPPPSPGGVPPHG